MQKYKKKGNRGLYDEEMTYEKLSEIGNPLNSKLKIMNDINFC